jgi:hypothetical protein
MYFLRVARLKNQQDQPAFGDSMSLPFPDGCCPHSLANGSGSYHLFSLYLSSLSLRLYYSQISLCLPLIGMFVIIFRAHLIIQDNLSISRSLTKSHLQSPFYHTRQRSQVPGIRGGYLGGPLFKSHTYIKFIARVLCSLMLH